MRRPKTEYERTIFKDKGKWKVIKSWTIRVLTEKHREWLTKQKIDNRKKKQITGHDKLNPRHTLNHTILCAHLSISVIGARYFGNYKEHIMQKRGVLLSLIICWF